MLIPNQQNNPDMLVGLVYGRQIKLHSILYLPRYKAASRKFIFYIIFISILSALPVHSYDVSMSFVYKLGDDKNEVIHVNDTDYNAGTPNALEFTGLSSKYISSRRGPSIFGLFFAGSDFYSASFNSSYSGSSYMLQMSQNHRDGRFIIGFTNATQGRLDDSMRTIDAQKIILNTIGGFVFAFRPSYYFIRIETGEDVTNFIKWSGAVRLLIKNNGLAGGLYNITVEV